MSDVVTHSLRLSQPPEVVWDTLANVLEQPSWNPELTLVERMPDVDGRLTWRETHKNGLVMNVTQLDAQRPRLLVWAMTDDRESLHTQWRITIDPTETGSRITITQDREIHSRLAKLITRVLIGHDSYLKLFLGSLATKFDETAKIE